MEADIVVLFMKLPLGVSLEEFADRVRYNTNQHVRGAYLIDAADEELLVEKINDDILNYEE